jgi:cytochrome P450
MGRIARALRIGREAARMAAGMAVERWQTGHVFNPLFHPLVRSVREWPYPLYRRLREHDPIHRSGAIPGWFLFRHADCLAVLRDQRFSADDRNFAGYARQRAWEIEDGLADPNLPDEPPMLRRDPPDHTRLRRLVSKAFTPRAIERLRPRVEALTEELLDGLARRGAFDLIHDFAVPLPVTVIAEMLGIPAADFAVFKRWSDHLVGFLDPLASPGPEVLRATVAEFDAYMMRLADERRREPADDLLSALVQAEEQGDRLSPQELQGTIALLLAAGNETTTNLIGNGVLALLRHPEQLARLSAEPGIAERAVEELLRWDSPVQLTMRIPLEPVELGGVRLAPHHAVVVVLGSANHDPAAFARPDVLDVGREPVEHAAFGYGIHFCLGAQLARLEGQVAIGELTRRFPNMRLAGEPPRWRRLTFLRGVEALPLRVGS